jgi:hypothetical protein
MPAPAFSIRGVCKKAFDEIAKCGWRFVGEEGVDFFGGRRQTDESVRGASDEGTPVGTLCRDERHRVELREHEVINGI